MNLNRNRIACASGALLSAATLATAVAPSATAVPSAWNFQVSSVAGGITSGGELALDAGRRQLFISDNDFIMTTKGKDITPQLKVLDPKVTKFDVDSKRPVGSISYTGQPWGVMLFGPVPALPVPQVPDGIALDTVNGRVITSNTHANGVTVAKMNARTTGAANHINVPGGHPMGIAADGPLHRAYVAMNSKNYVSVIDTLRGRETGRISNLFAPSFLEVDQSRHRLYVGNADYKNKKNNFVAVIDTRTNKLIKKITTPSNSRPKIDTATGRVFVASFDTGKISVIDPDSLTITDTVETKGSPNKLAIDPERRLVYAANLQKKTVTVIDADKLTVVKTVPVGAAIHTIAVDPKTGTLFGTQHQGGKLTLVKPSRA